MNHEAVYADALVSMSAYLTPTPPNESLLVSWHVLGICAAYATNKQVGQDNNQDKVLVTPLFVI